MRRSFAPLLAALALLAPASTAIAQDAREGYGPVNDVLGEVGEVSEQPASGSAPNTAAQEAPATASPSVQGNSLPFTGADVGLVAGLGLLLLVAGVGLRRLRTQP